MRAQIGLLVLLAACGRKPPPPAPPPPDVGVLQVQPSPVAVYEPYVGEVSAPQTIEIHPQVTGTIERQLFTDGDHVRQNDLLYVIDPRPFRAALAQARASLAGAQASLVNSEKNKERTDALVARQAAAPADADTAQAARDNAAASVRAARAAMHNAEIDLGWTQVRAPANGGTSLSRVRAGDLVNPQTTLVTLYAGAEATNVYFAMEQQMLPEMLAIASRDAGHQAQGADPPGDPPGDPPPPVTPEFRLLRGDGQPYRYPAMLESVDSGVDAKTGTIQVRLAVQNPDRELKPGEFVRVQVPVAFAPQGLLVPQQAVQELQGVQSVLLVDQNGTAQHRNIVARHRIGQDWLVDSGLSPGEMVIVEGTGKAQPGKPVHAVPLSR